MGEIVQKQILAHSYIKLIHKEFILFFYQTTEYYENTHLEVYL